MLSSTPLTSRSLLPDIACGYDSHACCWTCSFFLLFLVLVLHERLFRFTVLVDHLPCIVSCCLLYHHRRLLCPPPFFTPLVLYITSVISLSSSLAFHTHAISRIGFKDV
ncbi:hypothetical protein BJ322DRAFT_1067867 [Thelephora terrestris]|uniref:Uncharacterized protein n=1 Tax=Thelephora terrestris TaxID=56493 RepID=A0A9P6L692_9AGAM|nr:hypothetical protein BJ322DRAFT_1067867 [Thelephora terrestris]